MKVLLTGAFGNIGKSTLEELVRQGHIVRCFDLKTRSNEKAARRYRDRIQVVWGDLRRRADVAAAVRDQEVVIHLAFIIPKLSTTGFESEEHPDWAREINVGGTQNLIEAMKADIRYAENTVNFDDDKLKLIGWMGKKAPTALQPPGQSRLVEAPRQGDGWFFLDWKAPIDGGAPSAYKVTRRERPAGAWEDVATAVITEATLVEQLKGKELEYRTIAVNKAGDGELSNTEMVVL